MFPETGHSPMTPGQRQAAVFYLGLLRYAISRENCPFDPLTDIDAVTEAELEQSRIAKEYARFWKAVEDDYFIELMRIGREIMPFDPASHTIGVHHVAVHMARQALHREMCIRDSCQGLQALVKGRVRQLAQHPAQEFRDITGDLLPPRLQLAD